MNETTYVAYVINANRAADLARDNKLIVAQRERGELTATPQRRTGWFHAVIARTTATHHRTVAPTH